MASKNYKFRGFSGYAMMYRPDEFMDKEFWKISFYPETEAVLDKMKAKGVRLKVYEDDGEKSGVSGKYVVIKRPTEKEFKTGLVEFNPPSIYDKDGKGLVTYDKESGDRKGEPVLIGNGSLVEVTVSIYDAKPYGKGTRLESVKILDLIEYNPEEEDDAEESPEENPKVEEVEVVQADEKAAVREIKGDAKDDKKAVGVKPKTRW